LEYEINDKKEYLKLENEIPSIGYFAWGKSLPQQKGLVHKTAKGKRNIKTIVSYFHC